MTLDRRWAAAPFVTLGTGCVVAGGLVAAATAPTPTTHASWAAAYLVLVAGVAQVALGLGQAVLTPQAPSRGRVAARLATWNAGNAAVLGGTLAGVLPLVDLGGALLVIGLALLAPAVRGGAPPAHAERAMGAARLSAARVAVAGERAHRAAARPCWAELTAAARSACPASWPTEPVDRAAGKSQAVAATLDREDRRHDARAAEGSR